ncbi:MAG: DUF4145 domain-containing protein [Anaerolineales bacterium]|nr:MAG: DUF4145 domain-containing protein [Anaerolineales bacterium]
MSKFGFKEITPSNWLERDDVLRGFVRMSSDGQSQPITGDEYLRDILRPKLLESVPTDVQALFEVARGAMAYSYFFYPLYTLAAEQLFRVAEAALAHKCNALAAPKSRDSFKKRISWLVEEGVIPGSEFVRWDAVRELRNIASHPERQSIFTPGNAIGFLEGIAVQINSLFSGT